MNVASNVARRGLPQRVVYDAVRPSCPGARARAHTHDAHTNAPMLLLLLFFDFLFFLMRLYRALRGCSCGSRGFRMPTNMCLFFSQHGVAARAYCLDRSYRSLPLWLPPRMRFVLAALLWAGFFKPVNQLLFARNPTPPPARGSHAQRQWHAWYFPIHAWYSHRQLHALPRRQNGL